MSDYLKMPWSIKDTMDHLDKVRCILIRRLRAVNLHGKAEHDVAELNFDFNRAINALKENQQYLELCKPEEIEHFKTLARIIRQHGTIGKALDACAEYEAIGTLQEVREAMEIRNQGGKIK